MFLRKMTWRVGDRVELSEGNKCPVGRNRRPVDRSAWSGTNDVLVQAFLPQTDRRLNVRSSNNFRSVQLQTILLSTQYPIYHLERAKAAYFSINCIGEHTFLPMD